MTLYIYGCQRCGVNKVYVRRLKARSQSEGITLEVKNSKYDQAARDEHAQYLMDQNIEVDNYPALVVDGSTVSLLRDLV